MTTDRTMADAINQYHKGAVVPLRKKLNRVFLSEGNFTIPAGGWILENEKYAPNISASVTTENNAAICFDDNVAEIYNEGESVKGANFTNASVSIDSLGTAQITITGVAAKNVTLNALQPATISTSRLGDGAIHFYTDIGTSRQNNLTLLTSGF